MAAGHKWWQLRAGDVAPWIWHLPVSIRPGKYHQLGWLDRPWDVNEAEPLVSDIDAWEAAVMPRHELNGLVRSCGA